MSVRPTRASAECSLLAELRDRLSRWALVAASGGDVATIDYATRKVRWKATIEGSNPHSIKLLPNGAIAVADSKGWIRTTRLRVRCRTRTA